MKILIVEDEPDIAQLIRLYLEKEGFSCQHCRDGLTAIQIFETWHPNIMILDLMIPKLDGLEVCARVRRNPGPRDPYILMLTAKGEELDRIIGLSTGADDYMVKPFSPRELVARVRALLRRSLRDMPEDPPQGTRPDHQTSHFQLDIEQRTATRCLPNRSTEILDLTTLEFELLTAFLSSPGRVWSRAQLIEKLWGQDFFGDERVVDTHIARLRKKIEPDPSHPIFVKTVIGAGYKFEDVGNL